MGISVKSATCSVENGRLSGESGHPYLISGVGLRYKFSSVYSLFQLPPVGLHNRSFGTHGITPHIDFIGVAQQPITNGTGHGGVTDVEVPIFYWTLGLAMMVARAW
jgi:hypothetical protein